MAANKKNPLTQGGEPTQNALNDALQGAEGATEARVLVACGEHAPDAVVTGTPEEIEALTLAGLVDPHPDAVAYAKKG